MLTQQQKIGTSKGKLRVCIWNRALIECGFAIGQPIEVRQIDESHIHIVPVGESRRKVSRVVNHGNILPVIDIKETKTISLQGMGEAGGMVSVSIMPNLISISGKGA